MCHGPRLVGGRSWDWNSVPGNGPVQTGGPGGGRVQVVNTRSASSHLGLGQFPPQTAASPDEQKVFALWESGDMSDQVR